MNWRRLRPGETDHEMIWLGVSLASLALTWLWLRLGLPLPLCPLHAMTGCPCPSCGATRCVRFALGGDFAAAFLMNPLALCALAATAFFDAYAATVLALRLPRLRADGLPAWAGKSARLATVVTVAANWAWLVWRGV